MNNNEENQKLIIEYIPVIKNYKTNPKFTLIIFIILLISLSSLGFNLIKPKPVSDNKILINRLSALESELIKSQNIADMKKAEILILKKQIKSEQEKINNTKMEQISVYLANKNLKGKGVEVIIKEKNNFEENEKDGENNTEDELDEQMNKEQQIIHNEDLLRFVNFLWSLEAQGISINDVRLYTDSNIICDGAVIRINEKVVTPPFVIKAIGKNINREIVKKSPSVISLELRGMDVLIEEKEIILSKKQEK